MRSRTYLINLYSPSKSYLTSIAQTGVQVSNLSYSMIKIIFVSPGRSGLSVLLLICSALFWYHRNSVDNSISSMSLLHEFSGCEQTKGYLRLIFKRVHILQKRLLNNILNKWENLKISWYIHFTKLPILAWKNYL